MRQRIDRREFIQRTGVLGTGVAVAAMARAGSATKRAITFSAPTAEKFGWPIACQLYTFRQYSFYEAIDKIASLGIRYLEPCFFLPLRKGRTDLKTGESLPANVRTELKKRLADRGMKMVNYYAPLGADTGAFRAIFDFAKEMGVKTIVAEPPAAVMDAVEKYCEEYRINLAIHNHPKSPQSVYWKPENVLKVCKGRSKRIGSCADTGHWVRSGLNPVACLKKLQGRIISMHLKDVKEWAKPEARDVPLGTGKADYAAVLQELRRQKFRGVFAIEYEHQSPELMADVAKCVAFVEKSVKSF